MKMLIPFLAVVLVAGCNAAPDVPAVAAAPAVTPAPAVVPTPPVEAPMTGAEAKHASAMGVVQSIDAASPSVTIAHGAVETLGWPPMTMTFGAPGVDLSSIKAGDSVDFEFTSTGMNGTIVSISKR